MSTNKPSIGSAVVEIASTLIKNFKRRKKTLCTRHLFA